jgi:hypothetical protein
MDYDMMRDFNFFKEGDVLKNCDYVIHTACPFFKGKMKENDDNIKKYVDASKSLVESFSQ